MGILDSIRRVPIAMGLTRKAAPMATHPLYRGSMGGFGYGPKPNRLPVTAEQMAAMVACNAVAYTVVQRLSSAVAQVPFVAMGEDQSPDWNHPVTRLLAAPADGVGGWRMMYLVAQSLAITGNAYLRRIDSSARVSLPGGRRIVIPQVIEFCEPSAIRAEIGIDGTVTGYMYAQPGRMAIRLAPEEVLHLSNPWIGDTVNGLSPLIAAGSAVHSYAGIMSVTQATIDNGAVLPGFLTVEGLNITDAQFQELRNELVKRARDGDRTGSMAVLRSFDGEIKYLPVEMAESAISETTRAAVMADIANVWGYPPILLRMGEGSTFENLAQAQRYLWEQTIIPSYVVPIASGLSAWLGIPVSYDLSQVPAMRMASEARSKELSDNTFLTLDEKREAMSYGRYDPTDYPGVGNAILVPSTWIPIKSAADGRDGQSPIDAADAKAAAAEIEAWGHFEAATASRQTH